jgi:pimeloyl-ACP methyl ester carboxylesterase
MTGAPPRRLLALLGVCALTCLAWTPSTSHERAVELLMRLSGGPAPQGATSAEVTHRDLALPPSPGRPRTRLYEPARPLGRTLVVAHGVHHRGIDEPRLVRFSRELARLGFHVVTPELGDLADYRVTEPSLEAIVASVRDAGTRSDLPGGGKVGLIGISFGGGLSLVAASRPEVAPHLEYVASIGGHHDLARVLRFLLENRIATPHGLAPLEAHEYGLVVLVYGALDALAPAEDLAALRIVFRHWLMEDRELARRQSGALRTDRGRALWTALESGSLGALGGELTGWLEARRERLEALSPAGRLGAVRVPVYLLHGRSDRVIPPSELAWATSELESRPHAALVTSLIEHVMPDRPAGFLEKLLLVDTVANML